METRTSARKMLPLSEKDLRDLAVLRSSSTYKRAMGRLVATPVDDTEAQVLHAVFVVGMKAIEQKVEEESYAANAADFNAEMAARHAVRGRRSRPDTP